MEGDQGFSLKEEPLPFQQGCYLLEVGEHGRVELLAVVEELLFLDKYDVLADDVVVGYYCKLGHLVEPALLEPDFVLLLLLGFCVGFLFLVLLALFEGVVLVRARIMRNEALHIFLVLLLPPVALALGFQHLVGQDCQDFALGVL